MDKKQEVVVVTQKTPTSTRLKQAGLVAATTIATNYALADSSIDAAGLTGEIDGAKTIVLGLFAAGLVVLGIFAGYRYLKRGANSA